VSIDRPTHVIAVFGGACSGSVAAESLAKAGHQVVVFEQNARPYGKIEDGLPRWHKDQRRMEYAKIDARLTTPGVTFVPRTKLGQDLQFEDLVRWGWSAILLANGAWRDRPLEAPGAAELVGRGLLYQNPFVYWFNHSNEKSYDGPRYEVMPGAVCVGGGLASLDVIKIIQMELYGAALRARGLPYDIHEMEHDGIPKYLQKHGVADPKSLGVRDGALLYRRRVEDMPLAEPPAGASEAQKAKIAQVRQKLLGKAQEKFLFEMRAETVVKSLIVEGGRLRGLVLQKTQVEGRDAKPIAGSEHEWRTDLVISSIGSIPEPLPGVEMQGTYYRYKNWDTGEYGPVPGVFGVGNVVTGKGNIKALADHSKQVSAHLLEKYLGVGEAGERDISAGLAPGERKGEAGAGQVQAHLERVAPLPPAKAEALLARARARQREVGYADYKAWIAKVTPPDME
jgi:NADPH-dependent glutamate synthase beta subunit-like oxidoreductase